MRIIITFLLSCLLFLTTVTAQMFRSLNAPTDVHITWTASTSEGGTCCTYRVYRCTTSAIACVQASPGNFVLIKDIGAIRVYDDQNVSSGHTYYYATTAFDSVNGESSLSNVFTAIVP